MNAQICFLIMHQRLLGEKHCHLSGIVYFLVTEVCFLWFEKNLSLKFAYPALLLTSSTIRIILS